ncbi:protein kinase [Sorangium sp. So ce1504]|uniref:serine/threonine-protein kinase n=1 Tax=Sorangium sp. So ce1504 TaxID=3133337 RepID=UPI003F5F6DD9
MDPYKRRQLEDEVAQRDYAGLVSFFNANDLQIDRVDGLRPGSYDYFVLLHLTSERRKQLGLTGDELLAIILHHTPQQAWFFNEVRRKLRANDRLAKTAVLVISSDPNIVAQCAEAYPDGATGYKTAYIGLTHADIRALQTPVQRQEHLARAFAQQAFTVDHFDTRFPVPDDLFGRMPLVTQLEHDVVQGELGVAILGIRRVGKTSVLKRLTSQVVTRPGHDWLVALYDAQEENIDADAASAARGLLRQLRSSIADRGLPSGGQGSSDDPLASLRSQVRWAVERHQKRVLLAIDEIEWLVPTTDAVDPSEKARREREYVRLFGALRALKQAHQSQVALVVCGINETFCEIPDVGGVNNPGLDLFRTHYVPLLERPMMTQMLRTIGARMAVTLEDEFIDRVWSAFGGHAYLARQFCSVLSRATAVRPMVLRAADFDREYAQFLEQRADGVIKQVVQYLARFYPGEYEVLQRLSLGAPGNPKGSSLRHLRAYGLVDDSVTPQVTMDALRDFTAKHAVDEVRAGRFTLLQRLGEGATGTVWRAWDRQAGADRALKVYSSSASRDAADMEYRNLLALACDAVPRAYEVVEYDDRFALVMEYIPGRSLSTIVHESGGQMSTEALEAVTTHILAAVESLHPSAERRRALKRQLDERSQVTEEQLEEYFRLSQSGYLHRDLKPDNIIVTDESSWTVKLIDTQLAKRPDDANRTQVGTPAYAPPDWGVGKWDTSFDLYAIGVIFHELLFGERPRADDVLHHVRGLRASAEYRASLSEFFSRALAPSAAERFLSAADMRAAWEDVLTAPHGVTPA